MNQCEVCGQPNSPRNLVCFNNVWRCPDCHDDFLKREDPEQEGLEMTPDE